MRILRRMSGRTPIPLAAVVPLALACGLTQVTGKLSNIDDVGLARGRDGVLHVLVVGVG